MRLYIQATGTPGQSSSSLDRKKWIRPKTFLPAPDQATEIVTRSTSIESQLASPIADDEALSTPGSSTSRSMKIDARRMADTNFLFDIDEELSMNSSSTMSTHTSFLQDFRDDNLGSRKSLPGHENTEIVEEAKDPNPFEISHDHSGEKKNPPQQLKSCLESKRNSQKDFYSFATPEMALTESSSEESPWFDFASSSELTNPFQLFSEVQSPKSRIIETPAKHKTIQSSKSWPKATIALEGGSNEFRSRRNFVRYSTMMIRGSSVAEVTKMMAEDQVDPSIISLVLIAASESSHR